MRQKGETLELETNVREGTVVTFAGGSLCEEATVTFATPRDGGWLVLVDRSPFHPESLSWPDQPGDHGTLTFPGGEPHAIVDCLTGLVDPDRGILLTDAEAIAASRSGASLQAVVLHVVRSEIGMGNVIGRRARLDVATDRRADLSLQHTGVHVAALTLNRFADRFWTKDKPDRDGLGFANLDKAAVTRSSIDTERSVDTYRIGKSLRKKGFDRNAFLAALPDVEDAMNMHLRGALLGASTPTRVSPPEGRLDGRRIWSTTLDGIEISIPCGGTHIDDLSRILAIDVELETIEDGFMLTTRTLGKRLA